AASKRPRATVSFSAAHHPAASAITEKGARRSLKAVSTSLNSADRSLRSLLANMSVLVDVTWCPLLIGDPQSKILNRMSRRHGFLGNDPPEASLQFRCDIDRLKGIATQRGEVVVGGCARDFEHLLKNLGNFGDDWIFDTIGTLIHPAGV